MDERDLGGLGRLVCAMLVFGIVSPARGQTQDGADPTRRPGTTSHPLAGGTSGGGGSDESLTVLGHHSRFQPAPMPGAPMGPPPDKPAPHLGRYKISGDQTKKDGYDAQTGAYIAPFGSAYTSAGPVADGLAPRFGH